jgi:hypothetical protein
MIRSCKIDARLVIFIKTRGHASTTKLKSLTWSAVYSLQRLSSSYYSLRSTQDDVQFRRINLSHGSIIEFHLERQKFPPLQLILIKQTPIPMAVSNTFAQHMQLERQSFTSVPWSQLQGEISR